MARMYRAGTAFVQIVPSFEGIQRDIAKNLKKDLKNALSDKDAFSELEKSIEDTFSSALGKAREETRAEVRKMMTEVEKETTKGATASAKSIKKVVEKEFGGGVFGEEMRKIGSKLSKLVDAENFQGLAAEFSAARKDIERDVNILSTAFTKAGERDARNVERSYRRLKKNLDKLSSLEGTGLSSYRQANVKNAADLMGGENYERLVNARSEKELKELNRINNARLAEERRAAKAENQIVDAANRERARIDNEERKRQQLNDAKDAQRARERYRSLYETQYQSRRELGSITAGMGSRQEKLTTRRDTQIEAFQSRLQSVIAKLGEINNARPHVRINTGGAYDSLARLLSMMNRYEALKPEAEVALAGDEEVKRELEALKAYAERILDGVDFDIDVDDEDAKATLAALKTQAENLRDVKIGVDVDLDRATYETARAQIAALTKQTESLNIKLNSEGVYDDVVAIDLALQSLRDKEVGVDISERQAMAEIATIEAALKRLDDSDVDVKIDLDRNALPEFSREADLAATRMRRLTRQIKDAGTSMAESTQAFRIFTPMLTAISFAGAPVVSTLGGIVAGLGGIASFAPGAAAGLSPLLFAFAGLEDASKKYAKAQEALAVQKDKLTAAQKDAIEKWKGEKEAIGEATVAWIEYTSELKTQIMEVQKGAREGLFPGLQRSISTVMDRYAKPFTDFLKESGERLGAISQIWANQLTSDAAAGWFKRVGEDTEKYTVSLLGWVENVAKGMANLVDAFRPFAREFADWLVNSSQRFEDWSASLSGSSAFNAFLDSARSTLPRVGDLLKNLGEFFTDVVVAIQPFTDAILDAINGALDFINAMDPQVLGAILGAVGGLTGGLMVLSGVMAGVGALSAVVAAVGGSFFTQLAAGVGLFIAVSGTALGATSALEAETGLLGEAALTLGASLGGVAEFGRAVWGLFGDLLEAVEPLLPVVAQLIGDVVELGVGLGTGLVDALSVVVGWIAQAVDWFTQLPLGVQETALVVLAGALAFNKLQGAIGLAIPMLQSGLDLFMGWGSKGVGAIDAVVDATSGFSFSLEGTKKGLKGVGDAATSAWEALGTAGKATVVLIAVAGAAVALGAAFDKLNEKSDPTVQGADAITAALEGMSKSAQSAKTNLDSVFTPEEGDTLGSKALLFGPEIDSAADSMKYYAEMTQGAGRGMDELNQEMGTLFGMLGDTPLDVINKQFEEMDKSLASMAQTDPTAASAAFYEIAKAAADAGMSQEELNEKFGGYRAALEETALALGGIKLSNDEYTRWMMGEVPPAIQAAVEAEGAHAEGLAGVADETQRAADEAERLVNATNEMQNAFDQSQDSANAIQEAFQVVKDAGSMSRATLEGNSDAAKKVRDGLQAIRDESLKKAESDAILKGSTDGMSDALWKNYNALVDNLEQMFGNREEAERYANELYGIPGEVNSQADFDSKYANRQVDITQGKIDDLDDTTAKPDVKANTGKANKDINGVQDNLKDLTSKPWHVQVWMNITKWWDDLWDDGKVKKSDKAQKKNRPQDLKAEGGINLVGYAGGGLRPMEPVAQMVKPNTWRVVGDRMKDDEAYIPLDGSPRSWSILLEALKRMPGNPAAAFADGAIAFATGAVVAPAPVVPAVPGAPADPAAPADSSAVSAAFAALAAALGESWSTLLADMLAKTTQFFTDLGLLIVAQNGILLTSQQTANVQMATAWTTHLAALSTANSTHLALLASQSSAWRASQASATSTFFADTLSRTQSGTSAVRTAWSDHHSLMSGISATFRSNEHSRLDSFLNGTMLGVIRDFGSRAQSSWSSIWSQLVSSAQSIFSALPPAVGSILSSTSAKMNTHIVDPYNKIVADLDLNKKLTIARFPAQAKATGGHIALRDGGTMPGYTPGRDVHTFYSPTGGLLELSGGEPVLRPEAGLALGTDWVDGINAAARNAGVEGVRRFLGGQAFASGGFIQSFASGGTLMDAADWWIGKGAKASRHSRFNGGKRITSGHSSNSLHYQDRAVDLNFAAGTSSFEQGKFNQFLPAFKKEFPKIRVIWLTTGHYDHMHIDTGNGADIGNFSGASGGGGSLYDIGGALSGFVAKAQKEMGPGAIPELMGGIGAKVFTDLAKAKASEFIDPTTYPGDGVIPGAGPSGNFIPGKGVKRWAGVVREALERVRQPVTDAYVNMTLRRMNQESGGNPRAINNWDINAKRGTPSKGLMQVIDPTFRAFRDPGLPNNIWEPISNIVASMRYALKRYKSLPAAYNRRGGYADGGEIDLNPEVLLRDGGGNLPTGYNLIKNNLTHEETILPKTVSDVTKTFERLEQIVTGGGDGVTITDSNFGSSPEETAREIFRQKRMDAMATPVKF